MKHIRSAVVTVCLAILSTPSDAATLIPVPLPAGATGAAVYDINDNNVVTGFYVTSDNVQHGFFGTLDGQYTTFDAGGPNYTNGRGINNAGVIMGITDDGKGDALPFERATDGTITFVTTAGGQSMAQGVAGGINRQGTFVASGWNSDFSQYNGFFGKNAAFTKAINLSEGKTFPRDVNDHKDVVGFYLSPSDQEYHGFMLKKGVVTTIDYPDDRSTGTTLYGVNNSGLISGGWSDAKGLPYGFIYDPSTGMFTSLHEPHVKHGKFAQAFGINDAGLVAVNFVAADGPFIYCPRKPSKCPSGGFEIREKSVKAIAGAARHGKTGTLVQIRSSWVP